MSKDEHGSYSRLTPESAKSARLRNDSVRDRSQEALTNALRTTGRRATMAFSSQTWTYLFDAADRLSKITTTHVYDGSTVIAEVLSDGSLGILYTPGVDAYDLLTDYPALQRRTHHLAPRIHRRGHSVPELADISRRSVTIDATRTDSS